MMRSSSPHLTDRARDIAEQLREFRDGALDPVSADPGFKERLREDLWQLVLQLTADSRRAGVGSR